MSMKPISDWRDHGVKVIPASQLDLNTPQTPNMTRAAAITSARTGGEQIVGRHLHGRTQRQNGCTPSWRIGDGHLRRQGSGTYALG